MHSGSTWRLGHRPALDGLRGVAVLLVVAHHSGLFGAHAALGTTGVTVFFALSGYLITALLLQERQGAGRVSLTAFYARRVRRLLPALAVFLVAMVAAGFASRSSAALALLYVANISAATGHAATALGGLTHTWSLALEEQFYLVWPVVLIALHRRWGRRGVAWGAGVGAALSVLVRLALWVGGASFDRLYFGPDVRADALLIGCLAAAVGLRPAGAARWPLVVLAVLLFVPGDAQVVALPTLVAVATVAVIAHPARVLSSLVLRYVGCRSYAVYLWHFPLIFFLPSRLAMPHPVGVAVAIGLSFAAAEASWWVVERPALRLHRREGHRVEPHVAVAARHVDADVSARIYGNLAQDR